MAGWVNKIKSIPDANGPSLDLAFAWGGSTTSGGGFGLAEAAWFFYNVTDGTYLYSPSSLGASGSFAQVVPLQYGKQYLIVAVGRDSHQNYSVDLNNPYKSPSSVLTLPGAGGGGTNYGPHGFSVSFGPLTPPDAIPPTISGPNTSSSDVTLVGSDIYCKNNTLTVTYTASDTGGSGLAGIWIDGVQASSSGSASKTYTVTADFTSSAYARDNASNQSPTVSQLFKFDNIPPTISNFIVNSATTPVSGQDFFVDYPNTTCDFEFTVTDNESGLNSYKATNASGTVTTGSLSGASQTITLSHDLNEANSSEIKYELEVEDKAGNISTQSSPIVIVDDTPPTGTLAIDSSQTTNVVDSITYINTSDVKLSITKSDSESGLF